MELINQTGVPAELRVTSIEDRVRAGLLAAKATFDVSRGRLELVSEGEPAPVLADDEDTPLGLLPNDLQAPGNRPVCELMVLGAACARTPVGQMPVELRVGNRSVRLLVTGDRAWVQHGELFAATEPVPFVRMPLTWSRTFGGSEDVWIDDAARVPVQDPINPEGLGFNAYRTAKDLMSGLSRRAPRADEFARPLPNVEDAESPVRSPDDTPLPLCWAPLPQTNALIPMLIASWDGPGPPPYDRFQRSHPNLTLGKPPYDEKIILTGCTPKPLEFEFRRLSLTADYVVGERSGSRTLEAQRVVLLPDERRVLVTYYTYFGFVAAPDEERSLRLRTGS